MKKIAFFFFVTLFLTSCGETQRVIKKITIENTLNINRNFETVEIDISGVNEKDLSSIVVLDNNNSFVISQLVDTNLDGKKDQLLFQPSLEKNETKTYKIILSNTKKMNDSVFCYSRFVPERTDDYAWENNKVAFRTFGPKAQKMAESGVKGGTLSSGIDAWLKRVEQPIINLWYKRNSEKKGAYHIDHGEGLDNFHVGTSRGIGGTALRVDTTYFFSKNFTSYKTITTGPIRTSFILSYDTWNANGKIINETKHISLDYGQNLSRFEISVTGTETLSSGLTLHDKKGITTKNESNFWISHWENIQESEIGTGIVTTKPYFSSSEKYVTPEKDKSNYFLNLKVVDGKTIFYSGFGWLKSNQFKNQKDWENYLSNFSKKINNPLKVLIN